MVTCMIKTKHCTLLSRDEYFLFLWFFFWGHERNQPELLGCISMRLFVVFIVSGKYRQVLQLNTCLKIKQREKTHTQKKNDPQTISLMLPSRITIQGEYY